MFPWGAGALPTKNVKPQTFEKPASEGNDLAWALVALALGWWLL